MVGSKQLKGRGSLKPVQDVQMRFRDEVGLFKKNCTIYCTSDICTSVIIACLFERRRSVQLSGDYCIVNGQQLMCDTHAVPEQHVREL